MLSYLAHFEDVFGPLRVFRYLTFRSLCAIITALLIGFIISPWLFEKLKALKLRQSLRDVSEVGKLAGLHEGKKNTPTMGGLAIYISLVVTTLLWAHFNVYVGVALFVYTGLTLIGFLDDYRKVRQKNSKGVSGVLKLVLQGLIVFVALTILMAFPESAEKMSELWFPFYKYPVVMEIHPSLLFLFLFLVIAGSSNAINLTDGIDGLAIGCTVTSALAYAIMAFIAGNMILADYLFASYVAGSGELVIICLALVGASLAFLWYNAYPAEVFMGDTGSLALGGLIGIIAFMVNQPITLIIVGGIFVIEALSVILQVGSYKLRNKKRIFLMAPIHHHFELKGWHEAKVVIRFWIISLIFALAGLSTLKLR